MTTRDFLKSLAATAFGALGWAAAPVAVQAPIPYVLHQTTERVMAILPDGRTAFLTEGVLAGAKVDVLIVYVPWRVRPGCVRHLSGLHLSRDKTELRYRFVDIEQAKV